MHYHDWKLHKTEEIIFNCNSGGIPHQHCMDIMIAEKVKQFYYENTVCY